MSISNEIKKFLKILNIVGLCPFFVKNEFVFKTNFFTKIFTILIPLTVGLLTLTSYYHNTRKNLNFFHNLINGKIIGIFTLTAIVPYCATINYCFIIINGIIKKNLHISLVTKIFNIHWKNYKLYNKIKGSKKIKRNRQLSLIYVLLIYFISVIRTNSTYQLNIWEKIYSWIYPIIILTLLINSFYMRFIGVIILEEFCNVNNLQLQTITNDFLMIKQLYWKTFGNIIFMNIGVVLIGYVVYVYNLLYMFVRNYENYGYGSLISDYVLIVQPHVFKIVLVVNVLEDISQQVSFMDFIYFSVQRIELILAISNFVLGL